MNYRHAYHAGNFADVLKHAALVAVLEHLGRKPAPFAVLDSHAGRGLYDLAGEAARKTGESRGGILKLLERKDAPGVLGSYLSLVRGFGEGLYPGSPLLALKLLRAKDRLVAVEKQDDECRHLQALLADEPRARVICGDGYSVLRKLLPLAERRGVVLIDPPYEAENEFALATRALTDFYRRFATGIFLLWYPAKERAHVEAAIGEILTAGLKELIQLELDIGDGGDGRLDTTGLLVVNPPYGFASEMRAVGVFLAENLGIDNAAVFRSTILAGEG